MPPADRFRYAHRCGYLSTSPRAWEAAYVARQAVADVADTAWARQVLQRLLELSR